MSLESLIQLDQHITLWLNSFHSPASDQFWMFMSDVKVWFPAYLAVTVAAFWRLGWKRGLVVVLSLILTVVVVDQSATHLKEGLERLRPCYTTWMLDNGLNWPVNRPNYFGFFSGHASNTFAFAVVSCMGFRADKTCSCRIYGICVFLWAALVSISRVMMGMHYLGDILVGTLFGLAVGFVIGLLARTIILKANL